jgi:hypothetical protein
MKAIYLNRVKVNWLPAFSLTARVTPNWVAYKVIDFIE